MRIFFCSRNCIDVKKIGLPVSFSLFLMNLSLILVVSLTVHSLKRNPILRMRIAYMLLAHEFLNLVLEMQGIMHCIELHLAGKVLDTNCLAKTIRMIMTGNQYFLSVFKLHLCDIRNCQCNQTCMY